MTSKEKYKYYIEEIAGPVTETDLKYFRRMKMPRLYGFSNTDVLQIIVIIIGLIEGIVVLINNPEGNSILPKFWIMIYIVVKTLIMCGLLGVVNNCLTFSRSLWVTDKIRLAAIKVSLAKMKLLDSKVDLEDYVIGDSTFESCRDIIVPMRIEQEEYDELKSSNVSTLIIAK